LKEAAKNNSEKKENQEEDSKEGEKFTKMIRVKSMIMSYVNKDSPGPGGREEDDHFDSGMKYMLNANRSLGKIDESIHRENSLSRSSTSRSMGKPSDSRFSFSKLTDILTKNKPTTSTTTVEKKEDESTQKQRLTSEESTISKIEKESTKKKVVKGTRKSTKGNQTPKKTESTKIEIETEASEDKPKSPYKKPKSKDTPKRKEPKAVTDKSSAKKSRGKSEVRNSEKESKTKETFRKAESKSVAPQIVEPEVPTPSSRKSFIQKSHIVSKYVDTNKDLLTPRAAFLPTEDEQKSEELAKRLASREMSRSPRSNILEELASGLSEKGGKAKEVTTSSRFNLFETDIASSSSHRDNKSQQQQSGKRLANNLFAGVFQADEGKKSKKANKKPSTTKSLCIILVIFFTKFLVGPESGKKDTIDSGRTSKREIMFLNYSRDDLEKALEFCERFNFEYVPNDSTDIKNAEWIVYQGNHMPNDYKIALAMLKAKPILKHEWVDDSVKKLELQSYDDYKVKYHTGCKKSTKTLILASQ